MEIKQLSVQDIPAVLEVQVQCYIPELNERGDTFLKKLRLFPKGCMGYWQDSLLGAYVFSHPWKTGEIVPLDFGLNSLPADADCLYIHDLAVSPRLRGKGVGNQLVQQLFKIADSLGIKDFTLVAVQDSEPFWSKYGFRIREEMTYGANVPASKMTLTR
jgi:GNAT superfamily N-acetyltransferase